MILGIGIDVVDVDRMRHWRDDEKLLSRFFHTVEIETSLQRGSSAVLSLAARFAAKEAFGKAIGTGLRGITLKEIIVHNEHNGKPNIRLSGKALKAYNQLGGTSIFVSMTHEQKNAIAVVVIEGTEESYHG